MLQTESKSRLFGPSSFLQDKGGGGRSPGAPPLDPPLGLILHLILSSGSCGPLGS